MEQQSQFTIEFNSINRKKFYGIVDPLKTSIGTVVKQFYLNYATGGYPIKNIGLLVKNTIGNIVDLTLLDPKTKLSYILPTRTDWLKSKMSVEIKLRGHSGPHDYQIPIREETTKPAKSFVFFKINIRLPNGKIICEPFDVDMTVQDIITKLSDHTFDLRLCGKKLELTDKLGNLEIVPDSLFEIIKPVNANNQSVYLESHTSTDLSDALERSNEFVTIKSITGTVIANIKFVPEMTVHQLKYRFCTDTNLGYPCLTYQNQVMSQEKKLSDYEIKSGSVIVMAFENDPIPPENDPIPPEISPNIMKELEKTEKQIYVKTLIGKTITLPYTPFMTCLDLKILIEKKDGSPVNQQKLICSGKQLENDRTMADNTIPAYATCHLVIRLRGPELFQSIMKELKKTG